MPGGAVYTYRPYIPMPSAIGVRVTFRYTSHLYSGVLLVTLCFSEVPFDRRVKCLVGSTARVV